MKLEAKHDVERRGKEGVKKKLKLKLRKEIKRNFYLVLKSALYSTELVCSAQKTPIITPSQ